MAAQKDYFPSKLADIGPWANNLVVESTNAGWDLAFVPQYTAVDTATTAFNAAYTLSIAPATRTPVTVQATSDARVTLEAAVRDFVATIQADPGVTDAERAAAGITVPGGGGAPDTIPVLAPSLELRFSQPGTMRISVIDSEFPDSRAMPGGAPTLEIFAAIGAAPITDPALASYRGTFSRPLNDLPIAPAEVGQILSFFTRYTSPSATTGLKIGPWSPAMAITGQ